MNSNIMMDIDPLNSYECPQVPEFENYPVANSDDYTHPNLPYQYNKTDQGYFPHHNLPYAPNQDEPLQKNTEQVYNGSFSDTGNYGPENSGPQDSENTGTEPQEEEEEKDIKPDIVPKETGKKPRRYKPKGKTSSYWNKKIADKDFAFYGCSVCNLSYTNLQELDQHVIIHANRMTSYDLRVKNLKKRKRLKKDKKKKKKESKIKKEFEIEIKPEDGYIGTEKAAEFQDGDSQDRKCDLKNFDTGISENTGIGNSENNENYPSNAEIKKNKEDYINVYKCFGCNKQFALSYYLKIHVRSHTDEKPYTCSVCGQSFITASKLGRHNKRIHLSVRHQCRICYKFFSRFELLVAHFDKKHPEDKLEGEPYDYAAILPYLKELEEQLKLETDSKDPSIKPKDEMPKDEMSKDEKPNKDEKPKTEEIWHDPWPGEGPGQHVVETKEEKDHKFDVPLINPPLEKEQKPIPTAHVTIEEVKIDIKEEIEDSDGQEDKEVPLLDDVDGRGCDDDDDDDKEIKDKNIKIDPDRDSSSDEYFPSDTWARPPSPRPPSPPAPRTRGTPGTTCHICNKELSSKSYLRVHMRTHTGEKPFKCYICKRGFITASKMHRHVLTHDESWEGKDGIKPDGVKSEAESDDDEVLDKKKSKKPKKKSKLEKAKEKLLKKPKKTLQKKQKKYQKRPHVCDFCNKRFLHIETLQVHKKSHVNEPLVLKCHFCLEPQADDESRKAHEASHGGPKPYLCTICGKEYMKRESMVYHRRAHTDPKDQPDSKTFICDICSNKFNSQTKLQRHIISHSVAKFTLRYECPVCAHMFHTRYHVQMHLNTHMKEGLILEENRSAVLAMVLQNARKIPKSDGTTPTLSEPIAADERSRICNICGQIFQHFFYLEEHLKTHGSKIAIDDLEKEEEKKYTCNVCSKSFKLHYYLKLHSFTHTKEKPFICQQCGKGFITKGKLKRHLETHQGLKKYQCHVCYKFFTRPSYLRIHVRTIHGTQDYNFRDYGVGVSIGAISGISDG